MAATVATASAAVCITPARSRWSTALFPGAEPSVALTAWPAAGPSLRQTAAPRPGAWRGYCPGLRQLHPAQHHPRRQFCRHQRLRYQCEPDHRRRLQHQFRRQPQSERHQPQEYRSLLGSLADNGGPTQTMAMQSNSPAINRVPPALSPATDQRGVPRPQPQGGLSDIGAYELVTLPAILTQPQSQIVAQGSDATFTVFAFGDSRDIPVAFRRDRHLRRYFVGLYPKQRSGD